MKPAQDACTSDMMEQSNMPSERPREPRWAFDQQRGMGDGGRERYWPGNLMALGIFTILVSFWWVGMRTFIGMMALSKVLAVLAFTGNLLPYSWSGARLGMERLEWFLFNVLAVGPLLFSALLWVNYGVTGPERHYRLTDDGSVDVHRHWLEQGAMPPSEPFDPGRLDAAERARFLERHGERAVFTLARGCLGYDVIRYRSAAELFDGH